MRAIKHDRNTFDEECWDCYMVYGTNPGCANCVAQYKSERRLKRMRRISFFIQFCTLDSYYFNGRRIVARPDDAV